MISTLSGRCLEPFGATAALALASSFGRSPRGAACGWGSTGELGAHESEIAD